MQDFNQIEAGDELHIEMTSADGNDLEADVEVLEATPDGDGGWFQIDMNGTQVALMLSNTVAGLSPDGIGRIENNSQRIATVMSAEVA